MSDVELQHEVSQFLYREARLLDDRRYNEWLELMAPDVVYEAPTRHTRLRSGEDEPWELKEELADDDGLRFFEDDFMGLSLRVARLGTGMAWAEDPPSRTRHLISNVEVKPGDKDEEYRVYSSFLVYRSRLETQRDLFAGQRRDVLRRLDDGSLRIAKRTIIFDATVLPSNNLSILF